MPERYWFGNIPSGEGMCLRIWKIVDSALSYVSMLWDAAPGTNAVHRISEPF